MHIHKTTCLVALLAGTCSISADAQNYSQTCRATQVCTGSGDSRVCRSGSVCWLRASGPAGTAAIYLKPESGGGGGVLAYRKPYDQQPNGLMDCWKNVTAGAQVSSAFPYRNDGHTRHNGVDVTSAQGRGAPIRNMGKGTVSEIGTDPNAPNGVYVRVRQANGVEMTYIHLLDIHEGIATDRWVEVGDTLGRMNCTGNCGGARGSPGYQNPQSTHVHIQAKRLADNALLDPVAIHGGSSCGTGSGGNPGGGGGGPPGGGTGECSGGICNKEP